MSHIKDVHAPMIMVPLFFFQGTCMGLSLHMHAQSKWHMDIRIDVQYGQSPDHQIVLAGWFTKFSKVWGIWWIGAPLIIN